ncbi:hypothetical protein HKX48_003706 [Thoreauomyces humboldtii]|nr:hypothetical protein HKX48_003706 [Thoreauomyces humboldtii]
MYNSVDELAIDSGQEGVVKIDELLAENLGLDETLQTIVKVVADSVPNIKSRNVMRVLTEHAIRGRLEDEGLAVADRLSTYDVTDPDTAYAVYSLLMRLSDVCPNALRRLDSIEWLANLIQALVSHPVQGRMEQIASQLLYKVCDSRELSLAELGVFTDDLLDRLCSLIEDTREADEQNHDLIRLLLAVHDQFAQKNAARSVLSNPVLQTLERRIDRSKTLSENFILLFNRAEDRTLRLKMIGFLDNLLQNKGTQSLFYTNDLVVILDVVLRETKNVDADDEANTNACDFPAPQLHQRYIFLLPLLVNHPDASWTPERRREVQKLLEGIRDGPFVRPGTRVCAGKALQGRTRRDSE